jgi:hypothetical protein
VHDTSNDQRGVTIELRKREDMAHIYLMQVCKDDTSIYANV